MLEPMGQSLSDVNWSSKTQIELIIGLDNTDLLPVEAWKDCEKPQNLSFKKSRAVKKPCPIGTVTKKGSEVIMDGRNSFSVHLEEPPSEKTEADACKQIETNTYQRSDTTEENRKPIEEQSNNQNDEGCENSTTTNKCYFTALGLTEVEKYINKEGNIEMIDSKCEKHAEACKACSISKQITQADEIVLEKMKENLVAIPQPNNTYQLETKYTFLKDPNMVFAAEKSNYSTATKQAEKTFSKLLKEKGEEGKKEVREMFERGVKEGNFRLLNQEESREIMKGPHFFCHQTIARNANSKSTPLRHITNPSNYTPSHASSFNLALEKSPNLMCKLSWGLLPFLLFDVPYSVDIGHAYRKIKVHPSHQPYQLLVYYDLEDSQWKDNPMVVMQQTLMYGGIQSETILELAVRQATSKVQDKEIVRVILYQRLVDNILGSWRTHEEMLEAAKKIWGCLKNYNLDLKTEYDTLAKYQKDDTQEVINQDILFGYVWDRVGDCITPHIEIVNGKKIQGERRGKKVLDQPIKADQISRRTLLSLIMQAFDPLQRTVGPFLMKLKIINRLVCQVMPMESQNTPIHEIDSELAVRAADACNQLATIGQANPWPRVLLPTSETLSHVVVAKDGSLSGYAANLYLVTNERSRLVKAANKLHISSSPTNESFGHYLAVKLTEDVLEAVYENLIANGMNKIDIYIAGDNIPMLHALERDSREVSIRNSTAKTKILGTQIVKKFEGIALHFCYIPGAKNPSDYGSKEIENPIAAVDSKLWREGPSEFRNTEWLRKNTYGSIRKDTGKYVATTKEEVAEEALECNKIEIESGDNDSKYSEWKYTDEVIEEGGLSLQMVMEEYDGCIWKKKQDSWGDKIIQKCKMNEEEYNRIHDLSPTLPKLIANVAWTKIKIWDITRKKKEGKSFRPLSKLELIEEAYKCVILSSQCLYKPELKAGLYTREVEGIQVLLPGCSSPLLEELIGTERVPAIGPDEKLLKKIILFKHYTSVPMGIRKVHRPLVLTLQETRLPPFPTVFINAKKRIAACVREFCIQCKKTAPPLYSDIMQFHRLSQTQIFSRLSIDLVGPQYIKPNRNTRTRVKIWLLVAICLSTGALTCEITEDYSTAAVIKALLTIQNKNTPITELVTDAGSQLGMKKFWRSVWPQGEGLPTLSICDLQLLIQITINEINRTPLEEGSTLTPGDFIRTTKVLPNMLDLENIDNKQVEKDLKKIRGYYQALTDKMIKFKVGGDRLWKKSHRKRGQKTEIKKGDIVIVTNFPTGKRNRLGRVTDTGETSAKVQFANSENTYKKHDIIPVATGNDLSNPKGGGLEPVGKAEKES